MPSRPAVVVRAIALFGCEFFISYGMTECCGKISMSILPRDRAGMSGRQGSLGIAGRTVRHPETPGGGTVWCYLLIQTPSRLTESKLVGGALLCPGCRHVHNVQRSAPPLLPALQSRSSWRR